MTSSARPWVQPDDGDGREPSRASPAKKSEVPHTSGGRQGQEAQHRRSLGRRPVGGSARRGHAPATADTAYIAGVSSRTVTGRESPSSPAALEDLHHARLRPEIRLTEVPAPQRIAPYAVALTADVVDPRDTDDDLASGRFVLLHDPSAPEPWGGEWRAVTFARAELEPELATDPLLGEVGWSWLIDALAPRGLEYVAEAGTVTRVVTQSFAGLADRPASVEMEVRASWTPLGPEVGRAPARLVRPAVHHRRPAPAARGRRRPARTAPLR